MKYITPKLSTLTVIITPLLHAGYSQASQDRVEFNTSFMNRQSLQRIDVSRFENNQAVPGIYRIGIEVNGLPVGIHDVIVKDSLQDKSKSIFCLRKETMLNLGLDLSKLDARAIDTLDAATDDDCIDIADVVPTARMTLDSGEQLLLLEVPALFMERNPRGYVNPALWDRGINAGLLSYNSNLYHSVSRGREWNSAYTGINAGLNLMGWYLRHDGNWNWRDEDGSHYQALNTYLQRDIPQIGGRLTLGDTNTSGEQFDSISFRGMQLANVEQMMPESQRGYAPLITGVARTNAKVQVLQQGRLIYETTVPPGPFEINDLYPTGYSGNLEVVIAEADGTLQRQTVPYASMSNLLRPGTHHYSVTLGEIRKGWVNNEPEFMEMTYRRGLTNWLTGYAGLQGNSFYQAGQGGLALGTPIGAVSFDVTHAKTHLPSQYGEYGNYLSGQSYQLKYSQYIQETRSNISLAAYRFSTDGYMDLLSAMQLRELVDNTPQSSLLRRPKNRLGVTANQAMPERWGSFYLSTWQQNYWNSEGTDRQYQIGYSNQIGRVSYTLSANRNRNGLGDFENRYMLNLSIPLGSDRNRSQMSINLNKDPGGVLREQMTVSGSALDDRSLSYSASASHANKGGGSTGSLNSTWRAPYASLQGTVSKGQNYHSASAGINGAAVFHSGGATLTPYSGDTMALIEAKGAKGAKVGGYPGIEIDRFGYAVVPYLSAYEMNEVTLDPKGAGDDIEFENTSHKVAPYSGAVVKVDFTTTRGMGLLITLTDAGKRVPFGADVLDDGNNVVGVVGQGKRIYARVVKEAGTLRVRWGAEASQQCDVPYALQPGSKAGQNGLYNLTLTCK